MTHPETLAEEWQTRGACRGTDEPEKFFPEGSGPKGDQYRRIVSRYCDLCPVKDECLDTALALSIDHQHGIWGGTFPEDRRRILQNRKS